MYNEVNLEILDGFEGIGAAGQSLSEVIPAWNPDLLQAEPGRGRHGGFRILIGN